MSTVIHKVIIYYIDSFLRVYDGGTPIEVRGEIFVANTEENWKYMVKNIFVNPQDLYLKIIYDVYDPVILKYCFQFFSEVCELRIVNIRDEAISLYNLLQARTINVGGYVFGMQNGTNVLLDTEDADIEIDFDDMFNTRYFVQHILAKEDNLERKARELDRLRNVHKKLIKRLEQLSKQ